MPPPRAVQTLLLTPDPRQTPLGERTATEFGSIVHSPYGHSNGIAASRMGFNGQLRERQGWYLLGNGYRVYNPLLMHFHSADRLSPFGRGGINAYAYCQGDPLNFTDPTGAFVAELPSLIVQNYFETPLINLIHNTALLLGAIALNLAVPPAGPAVVASAASMVGAGMGITGATLQMAGQEEIGAPLSKVGTGVLSIASITRVYLGFKKLQDIGPLDWKELGKRTKNMFFGGYWKSKASMNKAVPAPAPADALGQGLVAHVIGRRNSAPAVLGAGNPASLKPVDTAQNLPATTAKLRENSKQSVFQAAMGHAGPYHEPNDLLVRSIRY